MTFRIHPLNGEIAESADPPDHNFVFASYREARNELLFLLDRRIRLCDNAIKRLLRTPAPPSSPPTLESA